MNNPIKYLVAFVIALILASAAYIFVQLGQNDAKAINEFSTAYNQFDLAITSYSETVLAYRNGGVPVPDTAEHKVAAAFLELNSKANARISSLTKNDGLIMQAFQKIAMVSGKEMEALKAYKNTAPDQKQDLDRLTKEINDWSNQRRSAYKIFLQLSGLMK